MAQRNPKANTFAKPAGYTDLGWQVSRDNESRKACMDAKHKTKEFDNSLYMHRGTDVITICDECKTVRHTDMSD